MKRSTCVSVFLVALATASVASAAPDNKRPAPARVKKKAPVKAEEKAKAPEPAPEPTPVFEQTVAQADPTAAPAAPATAAPAAGDTSGESPQPAVTLGTTTTTPGQDTPATVTPEQPKAKPKPRPFAGSNFYTTTSMSTNTVFRGQQQSAIPTVESAFWFLPRYAINEAFQLRGRFIVTYEYTNSNATDYRNEPIISDTGVSLFYRKLPKFWGIQPNVAANVALPTSKLSQMRTMVASTGVTLQLHKPIEHFLGGEAGIITSAIFTHPFYRSQQGEVQSDRPAGAVQCAGGSGDCNNLMIGPQNPANILSYTLLLEAEWGKWNPALYYLGSSQWMYGPAEANNPVDGRPLQEVPGGRSTTRQTHYFSAWLDYNFNNWFTGEVGYWMSRSATNASGAYANPFFDRFQDMRVYLGANFNLDNLVKELQGGGTGEAGVVRAKNTKQPMWQF